MATSGSARATGTRGTWRRRSASSRSTASAGSTYSATSRAPPHCSAMDGTSLWLTCAPKTQSWSAVWTGSPGTSRRVAIQHNLTKRDIGIIALEENINSADGSPAAKLFRRMMLAQGAYKLDSTRERIRAGIDRARAEGKRPSPPSPSRTPRTTGVSTQAARATHFARSPDWRGSPRPRSERLSRLGSAQFPRRQPGRGAKLVMRPPVAQGDHFPAYTCIDWRLVEAADHRVVAGRHQGAHGEHGPHPGATSGDGSPAPHLPAVPVHGATPARAAICLRPKVPSSGRSDSNATESGGPGRERSATGHPAPATQGSGAGSGATLGQVCQLLFQPLNMGPDAGSDGSAGAAQPVPLRHQHSTICVRRAVRGEWSSGVSESVRGSTGGRTASPKWARTCVSRASVLASLPVALAKWRTWRGLTTTTGREAAARGSSKPPVDSKTTTDGSRDCNSDTRPRIPSAS